MAPPAFLNSNKTRRRIGTKWRANAQVARARARAHYRFAFEPQ